MLELKRNHVPPSPAPGADADSNPYRAPQSDFSGGSRAGGGERVWRDGDVLVMDRDAQLPSRCIKCNRPASTRLLRKLSWHSPWLFLLIFAGILVYAIVAVIVRKRADVHIGLCTEHQQRRRRLSWIAWGLFGASIVSFIGSDVANTGAWVGVGFLLLLAAGVVCALAVRAVQPVRIDDRHVRLKGAGREFLSSLSTFAN
jgi:hypothetical protein